MFGKRLLTRLILSAAALVVLTPAASAADWFWYPQAMFHKPWDWPNGHWPSYYLYFTGTDYYSYYAVHYPMGGEDTYTVTPADIKWIRDPSKALIEIRVPFHDAAVMVDGKRMYREGLRRRFVSPKLETSGKYVYEIQATWMDDAGKTFKETRKVKFSSGERVTVDFNVPEVKEEK